MSGPGGRLARAVVAVAAVVMGFGLVGPLPAAHAVDTAAYLSFTAPLAQRETALYGVPTSVALAQSILESGWGTSILATQANAYFGIKCNTSASPYPIGCYAKTTTEYNPDGTTYQVVANFRSYASVANSFLDHGYFLSHSSRYAAAFAYAQNPDQFIREVAKAGYATSPTYATRVIALMVQYNLYAFDLTHDPNPTVADAGGFVALSPTRYVDTRYTLPVAANGTLDLLIAGRNGIPSDVAAVSVNITVTAPKTTGYIAAYPTGSVPNSSTLNFLGGQTVPNAAIVRIGTDGSITLRNASIGTTHLIVDVTGYYRAATSKVPGVYVPQPPVRVADSRNTGVVGPNADLVVDLSAQIAASLGAMTAPASAVLNITVTSPEAIGYATVYPSDSAMPVASTLNFVRGKTLANMTIVRVGADGRIRVRNASSGSTQVIVDLSGFFVGGAVTMHGGFVPLASPHRVLDTRLGLGYPTAAPPGATCILNPNQPNAAAVALNATVTEGGAVGYLVIWPADRDRPLASQINFLANDTEANFGQIRVSAARTLAFASMSSWPAHVIADVSGYYTV
jgi:Mannosyl-glycoprotein endo-beta-N-acetylglucosaminidase